MKCRIYKLSSPHTDRVYVGSTVLTLSRRYSKHRCDYRAGKDYGSCELLKLGEYDVEIELLEEIEIEHNEDPKRYCCEQKWMECTENICNIRRADKTAHMKEYIKEYYQANKEEISRYKAEKITCDCGSVVSRGGISTHRRTEKHLNYLASKPRTLIKVEIKLKSVE